MTPAAPSEHRIPSRSALLAWAILAITVIAMLATFWPGRLNIDTANQITEAATGEFTNRSTPLLLALWHAFWGLGFGPGAVFAAQVLTFVIGSYLVLRAAFRPTGAAAVTAIVVFWPPVLGNLASVQRDTWFAALLVLTFGVVVRATQRSWPIRGRYLALAIVAAWLALAARQNAAPAVLPACVVIAGLALVHWREVSSAAHRSPALARSSGILGAVVGGILLTLALIATQFLGTKLLEPRNVHPEAPLYVYDLAAISTRERENLFPPDLMPQREITPIDRTYDVDSALPFLFPDLGRIGPDFPRAVGFPDVGDAAAASLGRAWRTAIADHPDTYLAARWTLWLRQIGVTRDGLSVYPPDAEDNLGFSFAFPALYERALSYLEAFTYPDPAFGGQAAGGNVLFAVWIYLLAAAAAAGVLIRRGRRPPLVVVGTLALAALTYQVGLFFVALATRFRLELPSLVIGMLAAAVLLRLGWAWWRRRSETPYHQSVVSTPSSSSRDFV